MPQFPLPDIGLDVPSWLQNFLNDVQTNFSALGSYLDTQTPPNAVTGLKVTQNTLGNLVSWSANTGNTASYRLWRNTSASFASATLIAQLGGLSNVSYFDSVDQTVSNATRYYWIQAVTASGVVGPTAGNVSQSNFGSDPTSTAIGKDALAAGAGSVAVGPAATTGVGTNCVAVGQGANTGSGSNNLCFGQGTAVTGGSTGSLVFGSGASAGGGLDVVIGPAAGSGGGGLNIAIGRAASTAAGGTSQNVGIGYGVDLRGGNDVCIGVSSTTFGANDVAIGQSVTTGSGGDNTAVGQGATTASGNTANNVSVGKGSSAIGGSDVAIGVSATTGAGGLNVIVGGNTAVGTGARNVVIGQASTITGAGASSVLIGQNVTTSHTNVVSIGYVSSVVADGGTAIGQAATVNGTDGVGVGFTCNSGTGTSNISIGASTTAGGGNNNTVIGTSATSASGSSANNVVIGQGSNASGGSNSIVGQGSTVSGANSVSIGQGNTVTHTGCVVIGNAYMSTANNQIVLKSGTVSIPWDSSGNLVNPGTGQFTTMGVGGAILGASVLTVYGDQASSTGDPSHAQLILAGATSSAKRLLAGIDTTNNRGYLRAVQNSVGELPLDIQPLGGATIWGKNTLGDIVFNGSGTALATSATVGFPFVPTCAGTPTGVPAATYTGALPLVLDSTNSILYFYNSGWKGVNVSAIKSIQYGTITLTGGGSTTGTATISAVVVAKTALHDLGSDVSGITAMIDEDAYLTLTNTTTVTATRTGTGGTLVRSFCAVEYN